MSHARVSAAKFISRQLGEPYDTLLGGEPAHQLLAAASADRMCDPAGHWISWDDCYASADLLPLPYKARLLLDVRGCAVEPPALLAGKERERAAEAGRLAERIIGIARQLGVD